MIERITKWENLKNNKLGVTKDADKNETTSRQQIEKYFLCKEKGHFTRDCPNKSSKVGLVSGKAQLTNIKDQVVELNGSKHYLIFDSGPSINILFSEVVKYLDIEERKIDRPLTFFMLNNQKVYFDKYMVVKFSYGNYTSQEKFYIRKSDC